MTPSRAHQRNAGTDQEHGSENSRDCARTTAAARQLDEQGCGAQPGDAGQVPSEAQRADREVGPTEEFWQIAPAKQTDQNVTLTKIRVGESKHDAKTRS